MANVRVDDPPAPGTRVRAEVTSHHPWGVMVVLVEPVPGLTGSIDMILYSDMPDIRSADEYPAVGTQLDAVVLPYHKGHWIQLSVRSSDLAEAD